MHPKNIWLLFFMICNINALSVNYHHEIVQNLLTVATLDPSPCSLKIVESIPEGLVYNETSYDVTTIPTFEAWKSLLDLTTEKLDLASSYWTLRGEDVYQHPSDWKGEWIFRAIAKAAQEHGIQVRITENLQPNNDTDDLSKIDGIQVRSLNFSALIGAGILHTKLWISDEKHFYVGSANFDWRSLTQVKEMGVLATHCPSLAADMTKIFQVYWMLGGPGKSLPDSWPSDLETNINRMHPLEIQEENTSVFLSSSPPQFCPRGREIDVEAITYVIESAKKFIHIAVMDYSPTFLYTQDHLFWPHIDNLLRKAVIERNVQVKLLFSLWDHTKPNMIQFMKSLRALDGLYNNASIEAKLFKVPAFTPDQAEIPFARVNHNKYMVTEKHGFIGTSNWSADYFVNTGGIGFIFENHEANGKTFIYQQLHQVFLRDWFSGYSTHV